MTKQTRQIAHITVGNGPESIGVYTTYTGTNRIYVANFDDDTVSVIDGTKHTVIGRPIPVGHSPRC